ncbi:hypothetical protein, partial [Brevundimonas sp.]|uniref:hypothetical protein n=1 Tax=Brevundimonas sp. TaxID=1871086 RepID=UPI003919E2E6
VVRYTNYFCWHLVSAALALMSAGFFYSALPQRPAAPAAAATLFAATATILCLWLIVRFRLNPTHHPQWILFLPVVILGCLGLWR